ncbi:glycosyltransferase family 2 protein [Deinococcus altitudinis]|uniref:glycosyltransferase family 2 protein n=1 Tax=Deinococcus altitudinis TaxID=468914 RepID=UPI003892A754
MKKVVTVLLNWNGEKDTIECIASLKQLDYPDNTILVVDNDSRPESVEAVRLAHTDVEIIETGHNGGFSFGNNFGIRKAVEHGAEYIWILNNDTTVLPSSLRSMVDTAEEDENVGLVGSPIYYHDEPEKLQAWGGGPLDPITMRSSMFMYPVEDSKLGYLTGTSILFRVTALQQAGYFDDRFFMYWEDADLSLRLLHAKWKIAVAPGGKIYHKESASFANKKQSVIKTRYFIESTVIFISKHSEKPIVSMFLGVFLRMLNYLFKLRFDKIKNGLIGIYSAIKVIRLKNGKLRLKQ